jgi:hypothetical protein
LKYTHCSGVDGFDGTRKEAPKAVVKAIRVLRYKGSELRRLVQIFVIQNLYLNVLQQTPLETLKKTCNC